MFNLPPPNRPCEEENTRDDLNQLSPPIINSNGDFDAHNILWRNKKNKHKGEDLIYDSFNQNSRPRINRRVI